MKNKHTEGLKVKFGMAYMMDLKTSDEVNSEVQLEKPNN